MCDNCRPSKRRRQGHPTLEHGRHGVRGGAAQRAFATVLACLARRATIDARWRHLRYLARAPTLCIQTFLPVERARCDFLAPLCAIAAGPRGSVVAGGFVQVGGEALVMWHNDCAARHVLRPAVAAHVRALLRVGEEEVAVADEGGRVSVWRLRGAQHTTLQFEIAAQETPVLALALLACTAQRRDKTLATAGVGGRVQLWNLRTRARIGSFGGSVPHSSIFSMCTVEEGCHLFLCELRAGVSELRVSPGARPTMERVVVDTTLEVRGQLVHPRCCCALRGAYSAAAGGARCTIILRSATAAPAGAAASGIQVMSLPAMPFADIQAIAAIEPAERAAPHRFVATGSSDGVVRIWSLGSKRCVCDIAGHRAAVRALSFRLHRNVRYLVSGENDGRRGRLLTHDVGALLDELAAAERGPLGAASQGSTAPSEVV